MLANVRFYVIIFLEWYMQKKFKGFLTFFNTKIIVVFMCLQVCVCVCPPVDCAAAGL